MEKLFKVKQQGSTVRTEILAGLTTFMTMAYIIALNPNLLTGFAVGTPLWNGVFLATCISSGLATILMAFLANRPFALAPGMGLNSFFAVLAGNLAAMQGIEYENAFQACLVIIFVEGIVFLILSLFNIREKLIQAVPYGVRVGISPAIGIMLMNIGFGSNAGVYNSEGTPFYVMKDFFGALSPSVIRSSMGDAYPAMLLTVATMLIGVFIMVILNKKNVKGNVLIGMLAASIIYWAGQFLFLHTNPFESLQGASFLPPFGDMVKTTLFKLDFKGFIAMGWTTAITLIITFCIIDMFDTYGTLIGAATTGGMLDENGNLPCMRGAMLADSVGTIVGSVAGTSTVTSFVESSTGIEAGGRTGLASVVTGLLFLACIFIAPIAAIIPPAATSPALIYVGIIMLKGLKNIDFEDIDQLLPAVIMLLAMPICGSIGHAIGLALISYTVVKLFSGKGKDVSVLTYVLSLIFLVKFFVAF